MPASSDQLQRLDSPPLEMSDSQRGQLVEGAVELLEHLRERRSSAPIHQPTPDSLIEGLLRPPGEDGGSLPAILQMLNLAASCGWQKAHPGDLAYIPTGGLFSGVVAAFLAAGLNAYTGAAFEAPALIAIEESILRWLAHSLGFPPQSEGVMLSGGSLANQTAIACARAAGFDAERSRVYLCGNAHHSIHKALALCGVPARCVCPVQVNSAQQMDVRALSQSMARDSASGLDPWLVVGTAGSTDVGAIDDLEALARLSKSYSAWLHVDAAYGGMFVLTRRGSERLRGLGAVDSVTVDAHKGLMLPYGAAALLVRHRGALAKAHSGTGAYMRDVPQIPGLPHYFERGPELTRPYRGLLVWLPLQLHGVAAFRSALDRCLDLAEDAARRLASIPGIEVFSQPPLSIVAFRAADDTRTDAILTAINSSGKVHVSSTTLQGRLYVRLAFLNPVTSEAEIDCVMQAVESALRV